MGHPHFQGAGWAGEGKKTEVTSFSNATVHTTQESPPTLPCPLDTILGQVVNGGSLTVLSAKERAT